jgi:hypothetical protein
MGLISIFNLENLIQEFGIKIFFETGTGMGQGISHALNFNFKELYTIEIIDSIYQQCKEKFNGYQNCHFINDTSKNGIINFLPKIEQSDNIIFWLDAHFPGADFGLDSYGGTTEKEKRIPLEDELRTINKLRNISKDVFIIDDLRIYEDGPFESGNWSERITLGDDNINFIYEIFEKTHTIEKDYRNEGYIICKPKK